MKLTYATTKDSEVYKTAHELLKDMGYRYIGKVTYKQNHYRVSKPLYERHDQLFAVLGTETINHHVCGVKLGCVDSLKGDYNIIPYAEDGALKVGRA